MKGYWEKQNVRRSRIVRYHEREEELHVLSEAEQDKYEREQQPQEQNPPASSSSANASSPTVETMLSNMYVVNDAIEPETTREIIRWLETTFHHIPFTIIGGAAIVHHGLERTVWRVTMACPAECESAVFSWAKAAGAHRFRGDWSDSFGHRTADGRLCRVRVRRLLPAALSGVRTPRPRAADRPRVMTLPNIVNEYAALYAAGRRVLAGRQTILIEEDILWMLRRIPELERRDPDQAFVRREVTWLLEAEFWTPFTTNYPEVIELFRAAGVFRCLESSSSSSSSSGSGETTPTTTSSSSESFAGMHLDRGLDSLREMLGELIDWAEQGGLRPAHLSMPALQPSHQRAVRFVAQDSPFSSHVASPDCSSWASEYQSDRGSVPSLFLDEQVNRGTSARHSNLSAKW